MRTKVCPKCGHESVKEEDFFLLACPKCGAFYGAAYAEAKSKNPEPSGRGRPPFKTIFITLGLLLALAVSLQFGREALSRFQGSPSAGSINTPQEVVVHPKQSSAAIPVPPQKSEAVPIPPTAKKTSETQKNPPQSEPMPNISETNASMAIKKPEAVNSTDQTALKNSGKETALAAEEAAELAIRERKKKTTDHGVLTVSVRTQTTITFRVPLTREKIGPFRIGKGEHKAIKLKKGSYVAEIVQNGKRNLTTINFISNEGNLDL